MNSGILKKSRLLRDIIKIIAMVIIAAIAGYLALVIVYLLPIGPQREHVGRSVDMLKKEGISWNVVDGYDSTRLDNYTEGLTLNSAIYDEGESPFEKAAAIYQYRYDDAQMYYDALLRYYEGDSDYYSDEYSRDWHGYLVIIKPLLMFLDYSGIRMLNLIIQIGLICACIVGFYKKSETRDYLSALVTFLAAITAPVIFLSMEYSALLYVILISLLFIVFDHKLCEEQRLPLFFAAIGIVTAYVDVLTFPILTLGVPLIFIYVSGKRKDSCKSVIGYMAYHSLAWVVGYGGMWAMKWIIATIMTDKNIIKDAILMVIYRMSDNAADSGEIVAVTYGEILLRNISVYAHTPYIIAAIAAIVIVIVRVVKKAYHVDRDDILFFLIVFLMPAVWYLAVKNHSYIHYWMTHRDIALSFLALICLEIRSRDHGSDEICITRLCISRINHDDGSSSEKRSHF